MKTHAIIPIFIPHAGCPHDCIFCNQRAITARSAAPAPEETEAVIRRNLRTIRENPNIQTVEIAYYGGSFTGIPLDEQNRYLAIAQDFKMRGEVDRIRLSTRPDYIDEGILKNLRAHSVDLVELGVQSFDPEVLRKSARGYAPDAVRKSAALIRKNGLELGIQLMTGLPGDSYEKCIRSAEETVKLRPSVARIYPTVVVEDTVLCDMYREGRYAPPALEETVRTVKDMVRILTGAGVQVIRIGLKSTDIIKTEGGAAAAGFHPAIRQLVQAELAKDCLEEQLKALLDSDPAYDPSSVNDESQKSENCRRVTFYSHPASFSDMIGHRRSNKKHFEEKYPLLKIRFAVDPSMPGDAFRVELT